MNMKRVLTLLFVAITAAAITQTSIPEGSRIYIAPMGGFETNLIAALNEKKVPVVIVASRSTADFEVAGGAESQKANWMRIWVSGTWRTDEKASIVVKNLHTDVIVYAYEVNKWAAWHGSQSAAEACAKHIKHSMVRLPSEELAGFSASPRAKPDATVADVGATRGGATDVHPRSWVACQSTGGQGSRDYRSYSAGFGGIIRSSCGRCNQLGRWERGQNSNGIGSLDFRPSTGIANATWVHVP